MENAVEPSTSEIRVYNILLSVITYFPSLIYLLPKDCGQCTLGQCGDCMTNSGAV